MICEICGSTETVGKHCIDGNPRNLALLCAQCHQKVGNTKIVAVVSGGLDSTSFAAYCSKVLKAPLYVISFQYGQRAIKEVELAKEVLKGLYEEFKIINISDVKQVLGRNQLTDREVKVENKYTQNVVVPVRNAIMLSIATAYAYTVGANFVLYGAHLGDSSIGTNLYPDCSSSFQTAFEKAMYLGHYHKDEKGRLLGNEVTIGSPGKSKMGKDKLAEIGYKILGDKVFQTYSCYFGGKIHCGECESCMNRKKAFMQAGIRDKTIYEKI